MNGVSRGLAVVGGRRARLSNLSSGPYIISNSASCFPTDKMVSVTMWPLKALLTPQSLLYI